MLSATSFEGILEGRSESGECFRGERMIAVDFENKRDNVLYRSVHFIDHGVAQASKQQDVGMQMWKRWR